MSAHWRLVRAMFWLFCIFSAASCAAIRGAPEAPRSQKIAEIDTRRIISKDRLDTYDTTAVAEKKVKRNEIIDERILEIDTQYGRYEEQMWRERVGGNIAVDWTLLALSGATATVGGKELKAVLGATSTGVMGARESFDKQAFFEATLPALFTQMRAERAKVKARIAASKRLSAADYTIYAAMSDLLELVHAGTIRGILQAISLDAGTKEEVADQEIKQLLSGLFLRDAASDQLREFWKPNGTIDATNQKKLKDWMKKNLIDTGPGSITMFLKTAEMAALRAKAVVELTK